MNADLRILFLEDEPDEVELSVAVLEEAGLSFDWVRVDSREGFLTELETGDWDLILANHALPAFDGLTALRLVQKRGYDVPLILVSDALGEETAVESLKAGAADYVLKKGLSRLPVAVRGALNESEDRRKRREAEESLAQSEAHLRTVFDAADSIGFVTTNLDGEATRILAFSPGAERILGYSREEIVGQPVASLLSQETLEEFPRIQAALQVGEKGYRGEINLVRKGGEVFPALLTIHPLIGPSGEVTGAVGVTVDISERKKAEAALRESRDRLRDLTARLDVVREEERAAIARELHDEVGQPLTAMRWDLDQLEARLPPEDADLAGRIRSMIHLTGMAVERVNQVSRRIRSPELELLGLGEAIEAHAADLQDFSKIRMDISVPPEPIRPNKDRDFLLFRVAQEALANVARHSEATVAKVELLIQERGLILEIQDDGLGITDAQLTDPKSYGLIGMRERIERLGGTIDVYRSHPTGTTVRATVPLKAPDA